MYFGPKGSIVQKKFKKSTGFCFHSRDERLTICWLCRADVYQAYCKELPLHKCPPTHTHIHRNAGEQWRNFEYLSKSNKSIIHHKNNLLLQRSLHFLILLLVCLILLGDPILCLKLNLQSNYSCKKYNISL